MIMKGKAKTTDDDDDEEPYIYVDDDSSIVSGLTLSTTSTGTKPFIKSSSSKKKKRKTDKKSKKKHQKQSSSSKLAAITEKCDDDDETVEKAAPPLTTKRPAHVNRIVDNDSVLKASKHSSTSKKLSPTPTPSPPPPPALMDLETISTNHQKSSSNETSLNKKVGTGNSDNNDHDNKSISSKRSTKSTKSKVKPAPLAAAISSNTATARKPASVGSLKSPPPPNTNSSNKSSPSPPSKSKSKPPLSPTNNNSNHNGNLKKPPRAASVVAAAPVSAPLPVAVAAAAAAPPSKSKSITPSSVSKQPVASVSSKGSIDKGQMSKGGSAAAASSNGQPSSSAVATKPGAYHAQGGDIITRAEAGKLSSHDKKNMKAYDDRSYITTKTTATSSKKNGGVPKSPGGMVVSAELVDDVEAKIEEEVRRRLLQEAITADVVTDNAHLQPRVLNPIEEARRVADLKEIHKPKGVKEKLFGDARHDVDVASGESIRKRDYLQWQVQRSPTSNQWVASLLTNQKAMEEGDSIKMELSRINFSAQSQQEAYETGLSNAKPLMQKPEDAPICCVCKTKFAMFRRPTNCRNCGACVCSSCVTTWPSKMLPETYLTKKDKATVTGKSLQHFLKETITFVLIRFLPSTSFLYPCSVHILRLSCSFISKRTGFR